MILSKEEKIAREIATALNDLDSLSQHEAFAREYQEQFLRKTLNKVLARPKGSIDNPGAYYTSLVKKNGGDYLRM